MPAGGSSYLATMGRRSFSYHRLKKLPAAAPSSPPHPPATTTTPTTGLDQGGDPPCATAAAIEESYRSYYRALVARGRRPWRGSGRPRRRRLRVWGALARALRRRAAAAGARVRASVARVARRLREGRPYVGDLFAGNYMFLQVTPSPTTTVGGGTRGAVVPFAEYYYGCKARARAEAGDGAVQMHPAVAAAAAAVLYKV
ncbi:uncharacterized protein LOC8081317 [Sorghum bicolor]|uniref:Uncharacterized protein n=1 Tax=Sorghum bicolor TaxID=4558 RepID=A0A1B6Q829_SORBI|nr:uncharacterized protein LOC8081317 [Sorghum bicolor]KXG34084.2 hypothetical protein SORBI_3003G420201 [Sorghum bicolor]|eukprot:XP_002459069.2 uncharacterized protein LOC8081317 [Sorghum bicolor]